MSMGITGFGDLASALEEARERYAEKNAGAARQGGAVAGARPGAAGSGSVTPPPEELLRGMPAPKKALSSADATEVLLMLAKEVNDNSITAAKDQAQALHQQRQAKLDEATKKVVDEAKALQSRGFWSWISDAFSWIGKVIGLVAACAVAAITGGVAIAAAVCLAAKMLLDGIAQAVPELREFLDKSVFGRVLSGTLDVGAGLASWPGLAVSATSEVTRQLALSGVAWEGSPFLMGAVAVAASAVATFSKWDLTIASDPTKLQGAWKAAVTALKFAQDGAGVVSGAAQVEQVFAQRDADNARIDGEAIRLQAKKLAKLFQDVLDNIEDLFDRRKSLNNTIEEIMDKRFQTATAILRA
jgi:hypothetical protein